MTSILTLSFIPKSIAKKKFSAYFSGEFNLQIEDNNNIYEPNGRDKEILSEFDIEDSYLGLYIRDKNRDKSLGLTFILYPKGRIKLEFFSDRKFIGPWTDSIFLSYDTNNILDEINSNQKVQVNKNNASIKFHHKGGFFVKVANDQVLNIFRKGGEGFLIEATDIEGNFVNYKPAQVLELGWSLLQADISLVVEIDNGLESAFGGIKYDNANIFIPQAIKAYENKTISNFTACSTVAECNRRGDKMAWSYGDNADTNSSAQVYANQKIFGGLGDTDKIQEAINSFTDANISIVEAFLNATTVADTSRTLLTAYFEGKKAWDGVINLLGTADICHFSLYSTASTTTNCNDPALYGNSLRLLLNSSESVEAYALYSTARNYETEYYDLYLAARDEVSRVAALLNITANPDYQNGLTVLNNIVADSLLAESGNTDFNGYTQAIAATDAQIFYNSAADLTAFSNEVASITSSFNSLDTAINDKKIATNNNLAFKFQWAGNRLSLGFLSAVGKSKIEEQNYEATMAMAGLGVWYLVGKKLGLFVNGFQNQMQTDFQYPSSTFFAKNKRTKSSLDYGLDLIFDKESVFSLALGNGFTALETVSNNLTIQAKNEYTIFEMGFKAKFFNADLKIGYSTTIEKGISDRDIRYPSQVDINDKSSISRDLSNGEILTNRQLKISFLQKF